MYRKYQYVIENWLYLNLNSTLIYTVNVVFDPSAYLPHTPQFICELTVFFFVQYMFKVMLADVDNWM